MAAIEDIRASGAAMASALGNQGADPTENALRAWFANGRALAAWWVGDGELEGNVWTRSPLLA